MVESLTTPVVATLEGQYQRRDRAIEAVAAYCLVEDGAPVNPARSSTGARRPAGTSHRPAESPLYVATRAIFIKDKSKRPRICFICIGKALLLPPEDPQIDSLIYEFYTSGDLTKHF